METGKIKAIWSLSGDMDWCFGERFGKDKNVGLEKDNVGERQIKYFDDGDKNN